MDAPLRPPFQRFRLGLDELRGDRRQRGFDRGFVFSDHADWPSLVRTVEESGARQVLATHGNAHSFLRFLRERGVDAAELPGQCRERTREALRRAIS